MHEHPPSVLGFLTDGHYKIIYADGKTVEHTGAVGSVYFRPPVKHVVENLSDKNFELIEVELKAKPVAATVPTTDDALGDNKASSQ